MPFHGCIVVIKRSGADGSTFPLVNEECVLGRNERCDIRIQLPTVSSEHARISVRTTDGKILLEALSRTNPTKLNSQAISLEDLHELCHMDVITIGDRHFRWEYAPGSIHLRERPSEPALSATEMRPAALDVSSAVKRLREEEIGEAATPASKKRVSFGPYVSPEYFDKTLPPATPVRKGAVPASETMAAGAALTDTAKRPRQTSHVSALPKQAPIPEELSPKGVLRKSQGDFSLVKENSGHRSSPRGSPTRLSTAETSPSADKENSQNQLNTLQNGAPAQKAKSPGASPKAPLLVPKSPRPATPKAQLSKEQDLKQTESPKVKTPRLEKPMKATSPKTPKIPSPTASLTLQRKSPASEAKKTPKTGQTPTTKKAATPKSASPKRADSSKKTPKSETTKAKSPKTEASTPKSSKVKAQEQPSPKGKTPKVVTPKILASKNSPVGSPRSGQADSKKASPKTTPKTKTPTLKGVKRRSSISPPNKTKKLKTGSSPLTLAKLTARSPMTFYGAKAVKTAAAAADTVTPRKKAALTPTKAAGSTSNSLLKKVLVANQRAVTAAKVATPKMTPRGQIRLLAVKTPGSGVKARRPLWAEVVAKNNKAQQQEKKKSTKKIVPKPRKTNIVVKTPKKVARNLLASGHAASPETIVIGNKTKIQVAKMQVAKSPKLSSPAKSKTPITVITPVTPKVKTPASAKVKTPVSAKVKTPVSAKVKTPISAKVKTPISAKVKTPVSAKVKTPISAKVKTPISAKVKTPAPSKVKTPVSAKVKTPVSPKVKTPASPKVKTPASPKGKTPASSMAMTPASSMAMTPVSAKAMTPVPAKAMTPVSAKVKTPTSAQVKTPISAEVITPVSAKVKTPVSAKAKTPASAKVKTPASAKVKTLASVKVTPSSTPVRVPATPTPVKLTPKAKQASPVHIPSVSVDSPTPKRRGRPPKTPGSVSNPQSKEAIANVAKATGAESVDRKKTPRTTKTPRLSTAKKTKTGKTPGRVVSSAARRPLWSDAVRKYLGKTPKNAAGKTVLVAAKVAVKKKLVKAAKTPKRAVAGGAATTITTGHALSPEAIVIGGAGTKKAPLAVLPKKGRKSIVKLPSRKPVKDSTNFEGLAELLKTPARARPAATLSPKKSAPGTPRRKSISGGTPKKLDSVQKSTPQRRRQSIVVVTDMPAAGSPQPTNKHLARAIGIKVSASAKGNRRHSFRESPIRARDSKSLPGTPGNLNETNFDFDAVPTPSLPLDVFVSPLDSTKKGLKRRSSGMSKLLHPNVVSSPLSDYSNVSGIQDLLATPTPNKSSAKKARTDRRKSAPPADYSDFRGVKSMLATPKAPAKSPIADYTNVEGVKKLLATPIVQKSPRKADYTNIKGLKRLVATPKTQSSPKSDYSDVLGVKKLMKTPKGPAQSPKSDYSDVIGVKNLLKTPKLAAKSPGADYSDVRGVKKLLRTPKAAAESPKADYSNVQGLKKLVATPKASAKSPQADYSNVQGLKKLVATPKASARSPQADYSNVQGLKKLVATPKASAKSPQADYSNVQGLKKLVATPKASAKSPQADYTNVQGMKKLLATPRTPFNSPVANYTEVVGMRRLLATPGKGMVAPSPPGYNDMEGVSELLATPYNSPPAKKGSAAKVGSLKRRAGSQEDVSSSKKQRAMPHTPAQAESRGAMSSRGRGVSSSRSPAKTARGDTVASKLTSIPRFELSLNADNDQTEAVMIERSEASPALKPAPRGRRGAKTTTPGAAEEKAGDEKSVEHEPQAASPVKRGGKSDRRAVQEVKKDEALLKTAESAVASPAKVGRGRRAGAPALEPTPEQATTEPTLIKGRVGRRGAAAVAVEDCGVKTATPAKGGRGRPPVVAAVDLEVVTVDTEAKTTKGRRGRKAVAVVEEVEPTVVAEDQAETVLVTSPAKVAAGRRGRKAAAPVDDQSETTAIGTPVKAAAGRRGKQAAAIEEPTAVVEPPAETVGVATPVKTAAGRRGRKVAVPVEDQSETAAADTPAKAAAGRRGKQTIAVVKNVENGAVATPLKATAGRRGRQAAASVEEKPATAMVEAAAVASPVKAPTGRRGRQVVFLEDKVEAVATPDKTTTVRRGRKAATIAEEEPSVATPAKSAVSDRRGKAATEIVDESDKKTEAAASPAGTGRQGRKPKNTAEENPVVDTTVTAAKPAGRRGRAAEESIFSPQPTAVATPVKKGRSGKGKVTTEIKEEATADAEPTATMIERSGNAKRGRRGATAATEDKMTGTTPSPLQAKLASKKRQVVDDSVPVPVPEPAVSVSPPKTARGGGRAASKAAQAKIASDVAELSNLAKKKRRPSSPTKKDTDSATPAKGRGGKRKAADEEQAPASPPKRPTRGNRR